MEELWRLSHKNIDGTLKCESLSVPNLVNNSMAIQMFEQVTLSEMSPLSQHNYNSFPNFP